MSLPRTKKRERVAQGSIAVLALYAVVALMCQFGLLGADYAQQNAGEEQMAPGLSALLSGDSWDPFPADPHSEPIRIESFGQRWALAWEHPLGTDLLGRDVLARALHGSRYALAVGLLAAGIAVALGTLLGAAAGLLGGLPETLIVWLYSSVSSIPGILLVLALSFVLGGGFLAVFLALGLSSWVGTCRVVRGEVLKLRETDWIAAARAAGARPRGLLVRHLLPNLLPVAMVQFTLLFVYAVQTEVVISFLGVGIAEQPSWGAAIATSREQLQVGVWWPLAAVTTALFGLVLPVQWLGDALAERR